MMERSDTTNIQFSVFNFHFIAYKVVISIIFGLLGFVVNFYFSFSFPPYTATILIGLLFPMLITLTWDWASKIQVEDSDLLYYWAVGFSGNSIMSAANT